MKNEIKKIELDIELIKSVIAPNAQGLSDAEFKLFLYLAEKYQLDPMQKQIWIVKFNKRPAQIYAGRDGFLAIAHRSAQLDGFKTSVNRIDTPFSISYYDNASNKTVNYEQPFTYEATCIVYRKDMKYPIVVTVSEDEYSTGRNLWATKRKTMISKVSESQCFRKAFSISGLYDESEFNQSVKGIEQNTISEEMSVDEKIAAIQEPTLTDIKKFISATNSQEDIQYIRALAVEKNFDGEQMLAHLKGRNETEKN